MTTVKTQFHQDVYLPIAKWTASFNEQSEITRIRVDGPAYSIDTMSFQLWLGRRSLISTNFEILHEDEHQITKLAPGPSLGNPKVVRVFERPEFCGRKIMGWGSIVADTGHGFNLILLESEDSPYGDWRVLRNTNDVSAQKYRRDPEPFAFELVELERELALIGAMYVYHVTVEDLLCPGHAAELLKHALQLQ